MDLRSQQVIHQQVALDVVRLVTLKHEDRAQTELVASAHRLSGGVRLQVEPDDDRIRLLRHGAREAKLQVSKLVSAESDAGQVVALDEDPGSIPAAQRAGQVRRFGERRRLRDERYPRDASDVLAYIRKI